MIKGIRYRELPKYINQLQPFLEHFAERSLDRWTADSLRDEILRREKQAWLIDGKAVCLTSVSEHAVHVEALAGTDRHEWQDELHEEMTAWAKALGKERIIANVRSGWSRIMKNDKYGYRVAHVEMVKEID